MSSLSQLVLGFTLVAPYEGLSAHAQARIAQYENDAANFELQAEVYADAAAEYRDKASVATGRAHDEYQREAHACENLVEIMKANAANARRAIAYYRAKP